MFVTGGHNFIYSPTKDIVHGDHEEKDYRFDGDWQKKGDVDWQEDKKAHPRVQIQIKGGRYPQKNLSIGNYSHHANFEISRIFINVGDYVKSCTSNFTKSEARRRKKGHITQASISKILMVQ